MIAESLTPDLSVMMGREPGLHPVVIRMTPWSWGIFFNPCEKIPAILRTLSGCECGEQVRVVQSMVTSALQMWALGQYSSDVPDALREALVPRELRDYFTRLVAFSHAATKRPARLLRDDGRERLRQCLEAENAADGGVEAWLAGADFDDGERGIGFRGSAGLERFLAELLDSGDHGSIWVALACLWRASPQRIERLLASRVVLAMEWPVLHRLMVTHLTYQVSRGLRWSLVRRNLKRTLFNDSFVGYQVKCRRVTEVSPGARKRARRLRSKASTDGLPAASPR
jgi:hypothetical protein